MHRFFFSRLGLMDEANESAAPVLGGAEPTPAPAPSAEAPVTAGPIDRAKAILAGSIRNADQIAALTKENADLLAQHQAISLDRDSIAAQLHAVTIERDEAIGALSELNRLFDAEKAKVKTISAAVTDELSTIGVPAEKLPAIVPATEATETLEEIQAQAEAEHDPANKGALAMKALAIREQSIKTK